MRRGLLTLGLVALCPIVGCGSSDDKDEPSAAELLEKAKSATVAVTIKVDKRRFHGSGFIWDGRRARKMGNLPRGLVLTSTSTIWDRQGIEVQLRDGRKLGATLAARSPCDDVSVLVLDDLPPRLPELALARGEVAREGGGVTAIGYPERFRSKEGGKLATTQGTLSAAYVPTELQPLLPTFPSLLQHQAPLETGTAGGPLVDRRGRVIGLSTKIEEGGEHENADLSYAVASTHIQEMLGELTQDREGHPFGGWGNRHECHHDFSDIVHGQRGYTPKRYREHDETHTSGETKESSEEDKEGAHSGH